MHHIGLLPGANNMTPGSQKSARQGRAMKEREFQAIDHCQNIPLWFYWDEWWGHSRPHHGQVWSTIIIVFRIWRFIPSSYRWHAHIYCKYKPIKQTEIIILHGDNFALIMYFGPNSLVSDCNKNKNLFCKLITPFWGGFFAKKYAIFHIRHV